MDLSSLPQELQANVMRYQDLGTFQQLRKMNSHLNLIAVRYGMTKQIKVSEMEISFFSGKFKISLRLDTRLTDKNGLQKERQIIFSINSKEIPDLLNKIRLTCFLSLNSRVELNEAFVSLLHNHKKTFRNCTSLRINYANKNLSIDMKKKLLGIFSKLNKIAILECDNQGTTLINREVLGNRKWLTMDLKLIHGPLGTEINDDFLIEMAANCKLLNIFTFRKRFTFRGVIHVIKMLVSRGEGSVSLNIIHLGDIIYTETEEILRSIQGVRSVDIFEGGCHGVKSFLYNVRKPILENQAVGPIPCSRTEEPSISDVNFHKVVMMVLILTILNV